MARHLSGVVFDKDGTLFDFHATWGGWAARLLADLVPDDAGRRQALADALGYDLARQRFLAHSDVIAGTPGEVAALMLPFLPDWEAGPLVARMNRLAAEAALVETTPLRPLLSGLRARGLRIGLATNDAEEPARAHLEQAGVTALFDFVAGWDSGHGAKPGPGQILACARDFGLEPARLVMVGDSTHDLMAGRAAGAATVAVLTGLASAGELAPFADAVLPDIGHLPAWLDAD